MKPRIESCGPARVTPATIGREGMARHQKEQSPPSHAIQVPRDLVPLMQAFHVDSEKAAKALISEAANAIYVTHDFMKGKKIISKSEMAGIVSLMRGICPKDTLETLYAAQIIVGHMLGMRKLSESHADDYRLGLNLLRFSNEAMQQLAKKRSGGSQNITVNYNYAGHSNALMQTVISDKGA